MRASRLQLSSELEFVGISSSCRTMQQQPVCLMAAVCAMGCLMLLIVTSVQRVGRQLCTPKLCRCRLMPSLMCLLPGQITPPMLPTAVVPRPRPSFWASHCHSTRGLCSASSWAATRRSGGTRPGSRRCRRLQRDRPRLCPPPSWPPMASLPPLSLHPTCTTSPPILPSPRVGTPPSPLLAGDHRLARLPAGATPRPLAQRRGPGQEYLSATHLTPAVAPMRPLCLFHLPPLGGACCCGASSRPAVAAAVCIWPMLSFLAG